jgi:hypothetical protein
MGHGKGKEKSRKERSEIHDVHIQGVRKIPM